ncbi:hypothetical protein HAX54_004503 [Datura stramonium]|uniref:Cytochrome P450 n=1 Tax=Datura stramonium TaxID=4076 RepID=A0ABS8T8E2_DATST|nr:hypothetical protein [Datura stramonium]
MLELMMNTKAMKRAKAELVEVGENKAIEEADVGCLPYLRCILKETLRIHPPSSHLTRKVEQDVQVCGYFVPKGSQVLVNVWAIDRDLDIWEDPLTFKPERIWGSTNLDFHDNNFELIHFGVGRRMCVGLPLAIRAIPAMLGSLLNSFDWILEGGNNIAPEDLEEKFGLILAKSYLSGQWVVDLRSVEVQHEQVRSSSNLVSKERAVGISNAGRAHKEKIQDSSDEEVADSLIEEFAPNRQNEVEQVAKETNEVITIRNIRGIKSKGATNKLKKLIIKYKVEIVALLEPFLDNSQIDGFKRILGVDQAAHNVNGKLWIFWKDALDCEPSYKEKTEKTWRQEFQGNAQWILQQKLKSHSRNLSTWSRNNIEEDTEDHDNVFIHVEPVITYEDNSKIQEVPTEEEVKEAVFSITSESAAGPDGGPIYLEHPQTPKPGNSLVKDFFRHSNWTIETLEADTNPGILQPPICFWEYGKNDLGMCIEASWNRFRQQQYQPKFGQLLELKRQKLSAQIDYFHYSKYSVLGFVEGEMLPKIQQQVDI